MTYKKITILGGGNLGSSIASGLAESEAVLPKNITVTRRRLHLIKNLEERGITITDNNIEAAKDADLIVLAVKPHQIFGLLNEIQSVLKDGKQTLVSVITGIETAKLEAAVPGNPVFRAMPNTAISLRESMTCIAANSTFKEEEKNVTELFNNLGEAIVINEELMGAATVIGACGIAFALRFMRAMSQGGIEIGFSSDISQLITAQTIKGAAKLILESSNHPEKEIDKVTTPMGVTISGLNEMEHQGFSSSVIKGLLTSYNKLDLFKK